MSSVLTNNSAMVALETLRNTNRESEMIQNQIATGKKVSNAKDNAAVWAISTVMSTDVQSFNQISDTLNKASSTIGVARAASEEVTSLLQDTKKLIVDSQADMNDEDRARIQTDISALRTQIGNIVDAAQFNGVNLIKGEDNMNVLASLDRDEAGKVSATNIEVSRHDLSSTAAADAADKASTDAGYMAAASGASVTSTTPDIASGEAGFITVSGGAAAGGSLTALEANDLVLTLEDGDIKAGDVFSLSDLGADVTAADGDTLADIATKIESAITAANADTNIVIGDDGSGNTTLTITNTHATDALTFTAADIASTTTQETIAAGDDYAIDFAAGTITEGDTFTLSVDDKDVTYTAAADDDMAAVLAGLEADATAKSVSSDVTFTSEVAEDGTGTLTIAVDSGASAAINIDTSKTNAENAAVTAGGLAALADIDVSTASGATLALNAIDDLLDTAIGASASFGSSQGQIESQGEFVQTLVDSMTTGIGALVDADMEAASAKLQALQVQQQLGVQALSIANQAPQSLLSLFG